MFKPLSLVAILASILILLALSKQIADALDSGKRLEKMVDEVSQLQDKNRQLNDKLNKVQSYDFLEEVARDKLNLSKPNETVVVIPDDEINKVLNAQKPTPEPKIPNWQGWLKLFIH